MIRLPDANASFAVRVDSARWAWPLSLAFLLAAICTGCTDRTAGETDGLVTDMHEDFEHEHGSDSGGSHAHEHTHGHRHGKPLHGGILVSIGHTHHEGGINHFHAEVMPLKNDTIRLFVLKEVKDGQLQNYPLDLKELTALISIPGKESFSKELSLAAAAEGPTAEFHLQIPGEIADSDSYSVVVPLIKLDGQRQNFSFRAHRERPTKAPTDAEQTTESGQESNSNE